MKALTYDQIDVLKEHAAGRYWEFGCAPNPEIILALLEERERLLRVVEAAKAVASLEHAGNDALRFADHRELHDALGALEATS